MRPLTTAIDKGLRKIPGEKHEANLYALAPGEALRTSEPSEVIKVTPEMVKRAEYTYCLIWREGRVLAEFAVDDVLVAQPIKPDPQPKRGKNAEQLSGPRQDEDQRDDGAGAAGTSRPRATRADLAAGPGERSGSDQAHRDGAGKGRRRRLPDLL